MTITKTYEDLLEDARRKSIGGWAAVVDITRYMGKTWTTIAVSKTGPIVSQQRGGEFVGVLAQFRDGRGMNDTLPPLQPLIPATTFDANEPLPF